MTLFPHHQMMDISKIKTQLGYQAIVPLEKAIELTVKWYLENPLAPDGFEEKNLVTHMTMPGKTGLSRYGAKLQSS